MTINGVPLSVVNTFVLAPGQTQVPTPTPAPSNQDGFPTGVMVAIVFVGVGVVGIGIALVLYYTRKKTTTVTPERANMSTNFSRTFSRDTERARPTQRSFSDVMAVKILPLEKRGNSGRFLEAPSREYFLYSKSHLMSVTPTS